MKGLYLFLAAVLAAITVVAGTALAAGASTGGGTKSSVVYNSVVPNGPPANAPSVGAEAYAFNEFGNEINLAGTARHLNSVTVTLSSWACVTGHWNNGDCSTPAGATFSLPITLKIYNANTNGTAGSVIASATQTFAIPYRPSASPKCGDGRWYSSGTKTCFNGLADNVTFNFSGVTLPSTVVYGITYNTSHYGYNPVGDTQPCNATEAGCPYDSLNIALVNEGTDVTAGSDTNPDTIWQNSPYASQYCDSGTAGTGTFREDSPTCSDNYDPYVPAVQFKAGNGS